MFQLSAFQRNAYQIGSTRPAGGFLHEYLRAGKKRLDREAVTDAAIIPIKPIVDYDAGKAQSPAKQEQTNRPDYDQQRHLAEQILLLEYHITDSRERKRLSNDAALVILLLSE